MAYSHREDFPTPAVTVPRLYQPFAEVQISGYQAGDWIPGSEATHLKLQDMQDDVILLDLKDCAVFAKE